MKMKKIYNTPAELVINLGMEENVLLGVSSNKPATNDPSGPNPDDGSTQSRENTNLWDQEW